MCVWMIWIMLTLGIYSVSKPSSVTMPRANIVTTLGSSTSFLRARFTAKGSLEAAEYLGLASRMLTRGQLKVNTQIMSSDKALRQLGGIIDRMSMAIVIAGLFIGSSVVYYARIEPVVFGIPVIGFMGYVSALVLSLMLGRNIWLNSHGGKH